MGCNQSGLQRPPEVTIGQEVLEHFVQLEQQIAKEEASSPTSVLEQKRRQISKLQERITLMSDLDHLSSIATDALPGQEDLDDESSSTWKLFLEQGNLEEAQQREVQESLDAKNKEEMVRTERDSMVAKLAKLVDEVEELEQKDSHLQRLCDERDAILDRIFNGRYGSEEENRLEGILSLLIEMRRRVVTANIQWNQAHVLVDYAYKQLGFSVKAWEELPAIDHEDLERRYAKAVEVRNNLMAASQNIQAAQRHLYNVAFPYCAPSEVQTLNRAITYIFTDMHTEHRHQHAKECYVVTWRRCGALLHWILQVLEKTTKVDLEDMNLKVKEAATNLRYERVSLIKRKVKEVLGRDVDITVQDVNTDVKVEVDMTELATTAGIDPKLLTTLSSEELKMILEGGDLAPMPTSEEIFGKQMEHLTRELQEDMNKYETYQKETSNRMKSSLENKLAARRQRRAQRNLNNFELAHMSATNKEIAAQ